MNESDLIKEILNARLDNEGESDALTTMEICGRTGFGTEKVRRLIAQMIDDGTVEVVAVWRDNIATPITGRRGSSPSPSPNQLRARA